MRKTVKCSVPGVESICFAHCSLENAANIRFTHAKLAWKVEFCPLS